MELSPELVPGLLIIGLSVAFLAMVHTLCTVINDETKRRAAEMYAEAPPPSIDIATDLVDLARLRELAEKLNTAYCIRYNRLARMSEEDRKTRVGLELAYVCHLLMDLSSGVEKVVGVLDGSEKPSLADIKAGALEMLDSIEYEDETIPLKGVARLTLIR
jgi:hypothetical protein